MTATYSPALDNAISRVRQFYGDTDVTQAKIQDETITAYLTGGRSELGTAAQLCRDLAARYADRVTTGLDRQQTLNDQLYKHYTDMAALLEKRAGKEGVTTTEGFCGISVGGGDDRKWSPSTCYDRFLDGLT